MFPRIFLSAILNWALFVSRIAALNPLEIKGYKFFDSLTGEEVIIKGIDYYPRPNHGNLNQNSMDYFTEEYSHIWQRDIPYFQFLGVNAVRLYAVNGSKNHDAFMCALEAAGIYVIVALAHDCPTCAVTRDNALPDGKCYPPELKAQGQQVINTFAKYANTLAFSAGNEVNHFAPIHKPEWNAPCQKKFTRDMREYVDSCSKHMMRKIPIGLVAADSDRWENVMYYNCQEDPEDPYEHTEWYGLNAYVDCDGRAKTYKDALGMHSLQMSFEAYDMSIPVLLTEFGCLSDTYPTVNGYECQRNFLQAKWMLEEPGLRNQFAGGFAFEYSMEAANAAQASPYPFKTFGKQNYGIGTWTYLVERKASPVRQELTFGLFCLKGYFSPEMCDDIETPCEYNPLPSFDFLKTAFTESNISNATLMEEFEPSQRRQGRSVCPEQFPKLNSIEWEADKHPFAQCPARKESTFTCKAHSDYRLRIGNEGADLEFGLEAAAVLLIVLGLICGCFKFTSYRRRVEYHILTVKETDSQGSNESLGLMSLQGMSDPKAAYHAIESSDSSGDGVM